MGLQNRIVYDIVDLIEGRCRLGQALIRDKVLSNLYLLPAAQTRDKSAVSPADMVRVCAKLRGECDLVLIDSPAGIELGFRNAVAPADDFLLVTTPDRIAVQDVDRVLGILENEGPASTSLVINRIRPGLVRRQDMLNPDEIVETLRIKLVGIVPDDENVLVANSHGTPVAYDHRSPAGRAYHSMARRLLGEKVPFDFMRRGRRDILSLLGLKKRSK